MCMRERRGGELWWILNLAARGVGGVSNEPIGLYGVRVWKNIKSGWGTFLSHSRFEVGDGASVRFWHDLWCGNNALKEAFPNLYGITCV
jgi:hypothetical protein